MSELTFRGVPIVYDEGMPLWNDAIAARHLELDLELMAARAHQEIAWRARQILEDVEFDLEWVALQAWRNTYEHRLGRHRLGVPT